MTRSALQALPGATVGLVKKYVDKKGQKRIVGVPERLRQSQWLVCISRYMVALNIYIYISYIVKSNLY